MTALAGLTAARGCGEMGAGVRELVLVVFCRAPLVGRAKTRLIPAVGARGAAALADAFISDTLAKAALVPGVRVVIAGAEADTGPAGRYFQRLSRLSGAELLAQSRGGLGRRMFEALRRYAGKGALLMGSDVPSVPLALLARSVELLRRVPFVLAPSLDGGYYLVGARGGVPEVFAGIHWGTRRVLAQTMARLTARRVRFALGPAWYDVDRPSDLALLAAHLSLAGASKVARAARVHCPATARVLGRLGLLGERR